MPAKAKRKKSNPAESLPAASQPIWDVHWRGTITRDIGVLQVAADDEQSAREAFIAKYSSIRHIVSISATQTVDDQRNPEEEGTYELHYEELTKINSRGKGNTYLKLKRSFTARSYEDACAQAQAIWDEKMKAPPHKRPYFSRLSKIMNWEPS